MFRVIVTVAVAAAAAYSGLVIGATARAVKEAKDSESSKDSE